MQRVALAKEKLSKQALQTKEILSKQAVKIVKQAEEHEPFINKVIIIIIIIIPFLLLSLLRRFRSPHSISVRYSCVSASPNGLPFISPALSFVWYSMQMP